MPVAQPNAENTEAFRRLHKLIVDELDGQDAADAITILAGVFGTVVATACYPQPPCPLLDGLLPLAKVCATNRASTLAMQSNGCAGRA